MSTPNLQMDSLEKNKILHLFLKLNQQPQEMIEQNNIDASDLAALLQCCGFTLHSFEKVHDLTDVTEDSVSTTEGLKLRVEVTCTKSGMKAILSKEGLACKCPSKETASNAQFWNISGCGPSNKGNISISNSSLLPTVPPVQAKYVNILLARALSMISDTDVNQNDENYLEPFKNTSFLARHRSLETLKSEPPTASPRIQKNPTWDVASMASSPKQTSSPLPELCTSLKQISLDSEKSAKLIDNLSDIHKLVAESLEIAKRQNTTFTKCAKKRISDIKISPLVDANEKEYTSGSFNSMNKTRGENISIKGNTPKRNTPKKTAATTGDRKRFLVPPSRLSAFKTRGFNSGTPTTSKAVTPKVDTPRPRNKVEKVKDSFVNPTVMNLSGKKVSVRKDLAQSKLRPPTKLISASQVLPKRK